MSGKKMGLIHKLMTKLFLSCRKATELMEKKALDKIGFIEHIQLKWHNNMCKVCAIYEKQSLKLNNLLYSKKLDYQKCCELDKKETEDLKGKILSNLKEQ
jgi:hypothetical protein